MAQGFQSVGDGYRARLLSDELALLRQMFGDLADMLARPGRPDETPQWARDLGLTGLAGTTGEFRPAPHQDPALARLLPTARPDDEEADAEFRRLTEPGMRARKEASLRDSCVLFAAWQAESTGDQLLTAHQAQQLLTALTDVRLVLAERLGVRTDEDAVNLHASLEALAPRSDSLAEREQERIWMASVYEFLAWLQESLVTAMAQALPPPDGRRPAPPPPSD